MAGWDWMGWRLYGRIVDIKWINQNTKWCVCDYSNECCLLLLLVVFGLWKIHFLCEWIRPSHPFVWISIIINAWMELNCLFKMHSILITDTFSSALRWDPAMWMDLLDLGVLEKNWGWMIHYGVVINWYFFEMKINYIFVFHGS